VATVGERTIGRALVERVAAEQGLSPKQALDALVRDALLASAYSRSPGHLHAVRAARRSALAREMLQELRREAEAQGPPTDAEVQERTAKQWVDLDRPEATVTQHALVRVTSSEQEGAALAVAKAIRNAVASASSADDFDRLARAVPSGGLEVILERLPAVTADGRVVKLDDLSRGPSALEAAYASAAASLTGAGAVSEPVRSSYGFHVIRAIERLAAVHVPLEQRRKMLSAVVLADRARVANRKLLEAARAKTAPVIDRSFEQLTDRLAGEPRP